MLGILTLFIARFDEHSWLVVCMAFALTFSGVLWRKILAVFSNAGVVDAISDAVAPIHEVVVSRHHDVTADRRIMVTMKIEV